VRRLHGFVFHDSNNTHRSEEIFLMLTMWLRNEWTNWYELDLYTVLDWFEHDWICLFWPATISN